MVRLYNIRHTDNKQIYLATCSLPRHQCEIGNTQKQVSYHDSLIIDAKHRPWTSICFLHVNPWFGVIWKVENADPISDPKTVEARGHAKDVVPQSLLKCQSIV